MPMTITHIWSAFDEVTVWGNIDSPEQATSHTLPCVELIGWIVHSSQKLPEVRVRGKYFERYRRGTNVVLLDADVAEAFPTENAVNEALRAILGTTRAVRRAGGRSDRALQRATGDYKGRSRRK